MNQAAPSFTQAPPTAITRHRGEWIAACVLGVLLTAQLGWLERNALAANARLRPALEALCSALHCQLAPWQEPGAFSMLSRDVIAPPDQPGVLRVQASFRNDAHWPQLWPALTLTLSDINGHTLGTRRFLPSEYLGNTPHSAAIAPNQAQQIAFDIHEPSAGVVAFDFRFE